jgi:hypothetical protein
VGQSAGGGCCVRESDPAHRQVINVMWKACSVLDRPQHLPTPHRMSCGSEMFSGQSLQDPFVPVEKNVIALRMG